MRTKIIFLVLLFASYSCKKSANELVSDTDENNIKIEVKTVVNSIFKGCEEVKSNLVIESSYNSPDFVYLFNGTTLSYLEFSNALSAFYLQLSSQKVTLISEKYAIIDNSTVLYTTNCTFLQNFRDGHTTLIDPVVMLFIFKKIDGRWRWIYGVESYS